MFMRNLVLGTVTAVSIGSAVDAATYRYTVAYDRTVYSDVRVHDYGVVSHYDTLSDRDDTYGMPLLYPGLERGTSYDLSITYLEDGSVRCRLETYDCGITADPQWSFASEVDSHFGDEFFNVMIGRNSLRIWDVEKYSGHRFDLGPDLIIEARNRETYFTLAAVPVPTALSLFPIGFGLLAAIRRRPRKVS